MMHPRLYCGVRPPMSSQAGVALLTAILVVGLASVAAVALLEQDTRDINRTDMLLKVGRGDALQQGIEAWAIGQLTRDALDNQVDHGEENWALPLPPTAVTGGTVAGQIQDLSGRYNLNNLILAATSTSTSTPDQDKGRDDETGEPEDSGQSDTTGNSPKPETEQQRFARLLDVLGLDAALADAIIDWLDTDQQNHGSGGAEDLAYLARDPAYRTADRLFTDPSELLLIQGMDRSRFETLRPHISTLPLRTTINVNSATAPVLASLTGTLSLAQADALVSAQTGTPYQDIEGFLSAAGLEDRTELTSLLSVQSDWFIAQGLVTMDGLVRESRFLLYRKQRDDAPVQVHVVQRTRSRTQH